MNTNILGRDIDSLRTGLSGDRILVEVRFSAPVHIGPGTHTACCTMGTGFLSRKQSGRGLALTTHPHLAPRLKKECSYTCTSLLCLHVMFQVQFNFTPVSVEMCSVEYVLTFQVYALQFFLVNWVCVRCRI
jgi:hypothetical protein